MLQAINREDFCSKIYDLSNIAATSLQFKGLIPAVVCFYINGDYTDRMISDLETVSESLSGRGINFYTVDANVESSLTTQIGVRAIPTLLVIPVTGDPIILMGLIDKVGLEKILTKAIPRSIIL